MGLIKNKKGFAFTFLALFLVLLLFAYGQFQLSQNDYEKDLNYQEERILSLNQELSYLQKTYMKNALEFSTYNVMNSLIKESSENSSLYSIYHQDITELNSLVHEGLVNGSFDENSIDALEEKTLTHFIEEYQESFSNNFRGDIQINLTNLRVYESNVYHFSIQAHFDYTLTTYDNISSWNFSNEKIIEIPIHGLRDFQFNITGGKSFSNSAMIRPVERHASHVDWNITTFKQSIDEEYSNTFYHPDLKYMVGMSFLDRVLNISHGSYKNVIGFWSFDHDLSEKKVFDTSKRDISGKHFGNTKTLYSFNNQTISGASISDLSAYQNNATGDCTIVPGRHREGCEIGMGGVSISYNLEENSSYSISFWFRSSQTEENLLDQENNYNISLNASGNLFLEDSKSNLCSVDRTFNNGLWHHITFTFDIEENMTSLYTNGKKRNECENLEINFSKTNDFSSSFTGAIDEFSIYAKTLSSLEVTDIYGERKGIFIDYIDSLYDKAIKFDNTKNNLTIEDSTLIPNGPFSLGIWFKPYNVSNFTLLQLGSEKLEYNGSNFILSGVESDIIQLKKYQNHFLFLNYDGSELTFYLDSKNKGSRSTSISGVDKLMFGPKYKGETDEIILFNTQISEEKITNLYYNFDSYAKGCCNFITLIKGPDEDFDEVSFSSKLYYDHYKRSTSNDVVLLYNITGVTNTGSYGNFLVDECLLRAYHLPYTSDSDKPGYIEAVTPNANHRLCNELIYEGIY